jgi:uncharacterized membrane protein YphA (DoxX/SURF4 family)
VLDIALLVLRIVVGALFMLHAWDKFGNDDMEKWFRAIDLPFAWYQAQMARNLEMAGGILVLLGIGTWAGPSFLIAVMVGAIAIAHRKINPRVTHGGWEYCAVLIAVNLLFILVGFGAYTV